jgi:hypothetical protein
MCIWTRHTCWCWCMVRASLHLDHTCPEAAAPSNTPHMPMATSRPLSPGLCWSQCYAHPPPVMAGYPSAFNTLAHAVLLMSRYPSAHFIQQCQ